MPLFNNSINRNFKIGQANHKIKSINHNKAIYNDTLQSLNNKDTYNLKIVGEINPSDSLPRIEKGDALKILSDGIINGKNVKRGDIIVSVSNYVTNSNEWVIMNNL